MDTGAIKEIQRLGRLYERQHERMRKTEEQLRSFVRDYMDKNDFGKTSDELLEIIAYLPNGYFRFNMYETFYELREAEAAAAEQSETGQGDGTEKASVLEQIKAARDEQKQPSVPKQEQSKKKQGPEL